jgi:hypothetical protein
MFGAVAAADKAGGGCRLALKAADRAAVDAFYKVGLAADLDGNNIEAVCME